MSGAGRQGTRDREERGTDLCDAVDGAANREDAVGDAGDDLGDTGLDGGVLADLGDGGTAAADDDACERGRTRMARSGGGGGARERSVSSPLERVRARAACPDSCPCPSRAHSCSSPRQGEGRRARRFFPLEPRRVLDGDSRSSARSRAHTAQGAQEGDTTRVPHGSRGREGWKRAGELTGLLARDEGAQGEAVVLGLARLVDALVRVRVGAVGDRGRSRGSGGRVGRRALLGRRRRRARGSSGRGRGRRSGRGGGRGGRVGHGGGKGEPRGGGGGSGRVERRRGRGGGRGEIRRISYSQIQTRAIQPRLALTRSHSSTRQLVDRTALHGHTRHRLDALEQRTPLGPRHEHQLPLDLDPERLAPVLLPPPSRVLEHVLVRSHLQVGSSIVSRQSAQGRRGKEGEEERTFSTASSSAWYTHSLSSPALPASPGAAPLRPFFFLGPPSTAARMLASATSAASSAAFGSESRSAAVDRNTRDRNRRCEKWYGSFCATWDERRVSERALGATSLDDEGSGRREDDCGWLPHDQAIVERLGRTSSRAHCSSSSSILYMGGTICAGMLTRRSLKTSPTCLGAAAVDGSAGCERRDDSSAWKGDEEGSLARRYEVRADSALWSCGRRGARVSSIAPP